jgi:hypothetical protein
MKYMQNGAYRSSDLMRLTLGCTLVFLIFLWGTSALLYFQRMNLDPQSVVAYYRGSEQDFAAPRTYGSLLEQSHAHFAMMSMVLLLLTHLAIFVPWPVRLRVVLVLGTFAAALLGELAGWLVRYVAPGFAVLKVAAFLGLQAGLAILIAGLAWHLARRPVLSTGGVTAEESAASGRARR